MIPALMNETATSLERCLKDYWSPRYHAGKGNAIGEANVVTHFAYACLSENYLVYPEASNNQKGSSTQRLDLLVHGYTRAGRRTVQIRVQAKRLMPQKGANEMRNDVDIIHRFRMNENDNRGRNILRPSSTYGLLIAGTHYPCIGTWWMNPTEAGAGWRSLKNFLRREYVHRDSKKLTCRRDNEDVPLHLLWAWWDIGRTHRQPKA